MKWDSPPYCVLPDLQCAGDVAGRYLDGCEILQMRGKR